MAATFVSTSIPYVNAPPHVGFALELIQADVIARRRRQRGEDVFFLTGTDENALKNVQVAAEQGVTPAELCDRHAPRFEALVRAIDISPDGFIRTSSPEHHVGVQKLWRSCRAEDLAFGDYGGLYCQGCEDFYLERDLIDGRCPWHGVAPVEVAERNHFFRLSAFGELLDRELTSGGIRVVPEGRRNEATSLVRRGLRDLSISRSRRRSGGWGVAVPGDDQQTVYVWFDALANYLTGLGYGGEEEAFRRYWSDSRERIHVIGKDILRFHAVYWPAFLASAGLPLPTTIAVHGFLTVDGEKVSKSRGNVVDPFPIVERYGADALRYCLLRHVRASEDGDFSEQRLKEVYNADLANGLGTLVRRLETLCERAGYRGEAGPLPEAPSDVEHALDGFQYHGALELVWQRVADLNRSIERERPWDLLRPGNSGKLGDLLCRWVLAMRTIAEALAPLLPATAQQIRERFGREQVSVGEPLFPRIG